MGGGISDFFSGAGDVLSDIGGGISDAVSGIGNVLGDIGSGIGNVASDVGGFLENIPTELGNAWQGINDLGLDNILATIGTVIPGPWTPAAMAYNFGDAALSGDTGGMLSSGLGALGGLGGGGELPGLSSLFDSSSVIADLAGTAQNATPFAETAGEWFKPITQSFDQAGGSDLLTNLAGQGARQAQQVSQGLGLGTQGGGMSSLFDLVSSNPANTGSSWGLGNLFEGLGGVGGLTKLASPILKGVGGILGAQEASQNKSQLQDMMNQMQNRNQFYQNQLQQTYQNPQAYLASPEAQALRSAAGQAIAREDARTGRRGQYTAAMNQLNQQMLGNLNKYRQGLAGQVSPQYDASQLALQRALMAQSPTGNVMAGLGSIFGK
jgi:hypothetical protein